MNENDWQNFEEWFDNSGIDSKLKSFVKIGWNECLENVCSYFGEMEGIDHDAYEKFYAE